VTLLPRGYILEYHDNVSRANAHNNLKKHAIDYKIRNEYDVFNGAAITVKSDHDGEALAAVPGVKNVWRIQLYSIPKIESKGSQKPSREEIEKNSVHHMTGVDAAHKKLKLTGKGVKVGIIDTGIDYKHPAFATSGATEGCFARFGKKCRVAHGWDFVGDAYTGMNSPQPDSDPMDCDGHGSHVAGIVGGNALDVKVGPKPLVPWVGVAPEVTFGAYRIFGCDGSTGTDVILAAMEMAFNDGMDVSVLYFFRPYFFRLRAPNFELVHIANLATNNKPLLPGFPCFSFHYNRSLTCPWAVDRLTRRTQPPSSARS